MNKLYTAQEIADKLQIKKTTVYELIKRGELYSSKVGKQLRIMAKLPDKDSILVGRYLSGDGKHPPPCKLGVPLLLHRFGGVP